MVGFFTGMAVGTNVITARYFGGRQYDKLKSLIHTIFLAGLVGGIALVIFAEIFAPFFAGSAGCGQPWHWDHQYVDGNNLWWHFSRFAEAVKGVDPAAEHFRPFHTETRRLRIWGLRGERTTLLWCRDKANTWENELVRGEVPNTVAGEKIPFREGFKCYLPWENRWVVAEKGGILPDFTRSIVVCISNRNGE